MNKADYVLRQSQTREHSCHWPGCDRQVPPAMWGCRNHWFKLPLDLRQDLWAAYTPGQEKGEADVTPAYFAAAHAIQEWIAARLAKEADVKRAVEAQGNLLL
jgi:hypothetical protein